MAASALRARCIVPFCGRKAVGEPDDEAFCERHWRIAAGPLRRRYEAAWAEADRADRLGMEDAHAFRRVTDAWEALKAAVLGRAM